MLNYKKNIAGSYPIKYLIIFLLFYTTFWTFAIAQERFAEVINASDITTIPVKTSARECVDICIKNQEKNLNITKHLIMPLLHMIFLDQILD